jgi:anti-anti-sigma factor
MSAGLVRVSVERHGVVRVLAVSGELDLTTAAEFEERSSRALDGRFERFVLDLSGLRFVDCCGARALADVTHAVPDECPVIVRAVRPPVRRVLDLLGLVDMERRQAAGLAGEHRLAEGPGGPGGSGLPSRQLAVTWTRSQYVMAETRMLAGLVAATEDQLAATFARLAERRPHVAERMRNLSEEARREATKLRERAQADLLVAAAVVPLTPEAVAVSDPRPCEQCGAVFVPHREHARFCSGSCRDRWNREHGGDVTTGASALRWTVTAMRNVTEWLASAGAQDRSQAFEAISEAVWWVTIVDATMNRHYIEAYENVMHAQPAAARRVIEETLCGLRFVRNEMGYHIDPADFVAPTQNSPGQAGGPQGPLTAWSWRSLPEPDLAWLPARGRAWEMTRYRAYQAQLAGHYVGETFGRAAAFLRLASARATRRAWADTQLARAQARAETRG